MVAARLRGAQSVSHAGSDRRAVAGHQVHQRRTDWRGRVTNPFTGTWTYRSLLNDPDVSLDFDKLEFGRGTIEIQETDPNVLTGTIGGPGWSLALHGGFGFGSPMQ